MARRTPIIRAGFQLSPSRRQLFRRSCRAGRTRQVAFERRWRKEEPARRRAVAAEREQERLCASPGAARRPSMARRRGRNACARRRFGTARDRPPQCFGRGQGLGRAKCSRPPVARRNRCEILEANAFIVQEAARRILPSQAICSSLASARSELLHRASPPAGRQPGEGQGAAISGTSKALSELGAIPLGSATELLRSRVCCGIRKTQQRRLASSRCTSRGLPRGVDGGAAPIRYAGVAISQLGKLA